MLSKIHYLDNAATERVLPEAADAALGVMLDNYGNPSSLHRAGLDAARILKESREQVARAMGCRPAELYFTSGGTESINTALAGAASKNRSKFYHIVASSVEHDATLRALKRLEASGFEVSCIAPGKDGAVSARDILSAVRDDTVFVTLMGVNNETGAIMPVREVADGLRAMNSRALLHADMVQAFCKIKQAPALCGADMVSVSGHKIGAPKGVGALYVKSGLSIPPLIVGGGQESGFRSGTENMPAIAAFGCACELRRQNLDRDYLHVCELNLYARHKISALVPECVFISEQAVCAPHILSFSVPGAKSEVVLRILSDRGVYISAGSACSKGKKSHVLTAMRLPPQISDAALRVSFCPENDKDDIDALAAALAEAYAVFSV